MDADGDPRRIFSISPSLEIEAVKVMNISNSCVADKDVHNAEFQNGLPDSFHRSVHVQVYTIQSMKKGIKIGKKRCDPEKLYGRLLVVSQKHEILENVFSFELAPLPSSVV